MDILLSHGYFIAEDAHEQKIMKPYPTLGLLYISSHLKARGFAVDLYDSTFETLADFEVYVRETRPPVVGLYCNLMTKQNVLTMIRVCREVGAKVIVGGPVASTRLSRSAPDSPWNSPKNRNVSSAVRR